ncbi:hypothetical protein [Streptomyces sp. NPDC059819]|uniref:hypothetical protein n=1 Tax=Streptomyces sp. NPDC059819 TaxID=3346963 RepID=UPI00364D0510
MREPHVREPHLRDDVPPARDAESRLLPIGTTADVSGATVAPFAAGPVAGARPDLVTARPPELGR